MSKGFINSKLCYLVQMPRMQIKCLMTLLSKWFKLKPIIKKASLIHQLGFRATNQDGHPTCPQLNNSTSNVKYIVLDFAMCYEWKIVL